jgi:two-component system, chemotaxis family, protein-glutamate methylesterase/glutaminase
VGILLTGASSDGASGASRILKGGGVVLVQDPETAECPVMPQAAISASAASKVLTLDAIAAALGKFPLCKDRGQI